MIRVLLVSVLAAQWLGGAERNTREGAEHFAAGRLEEALRAFARARADHPDAPATGLNLAGVQYRLGEDGASGAPGEGGPLVEAARGYQAALSEGLDDGLAGDAWFNLGNTLYRAGAFEEAAAAYGEALAADPQDAEARRNLERALLRAQEQQDQQPSEDAEQNPSEDQEQNPSDDPEQSPAGDQERNPSGEQDPPGEQEQDRSEDPEQNPSGDQEQDQSGEPAQDPPGGERDPSDEAEPPDPAPGADSPAAGDPGEVPDVTPEQAERILAALAEVERAFQQDQLEKRRARALRRGRH